MLEIQGSYGCTQILKRKANDSKNEPVIQDVFCVSVILYHTEAGSCYLETTVMNWPKLTLQTGDSVIY